MGIQVQLVPMSSEDKTCRLMFRSKEKTVFCSFSSCNKTVNILDSFGQSQQGPSPPGIVSMLSSPERNNKFLISTSEKDINEMVDPQNERSLP